MKGTHIVQTPFTLKVFLSPHQHVCARCTVLIHSPDPVQIDILELDLVLEVLQLEPAPLKRQRASAAHGMSTIL